MPFNYLNYHDAKHFTTTCCKIQQLMKMRKTKNGKVGHLLQNAAKKEFKKYLELKKTRNIPE